MTSTDWFTEARFGMFVHWGLYALPARQEWVMSREQREVDDYARYAEFFDPDLFDARAWARTAREAGMKYAVLTTKHHDGFCLWDSHLTDYTVMNTPFGRDVVREFVDAVRAEGLKVGFYHSLLDWHHPDFLIDGCHPLRERPDLEELNAERVWSRYVDYLHGQVRELLTEYGDIDYLFFDFSYETDAEHEQWKGKGAADWSSEELLKTVRTLQPGIIVNDRLGIPGDLVTPEQYQPSGPMTDANGEELIWEACLTINGAWGYDRGNPADKSPELLLQMLIDGVSKNGNLLLNVGPTGRGDFGSRADQALAAVGRWMDRNSRAIYGAGASSFEPPRDARYTQRGNRLYLHLFSWPLAHIHLADLAGKVKYAQLLTDASELSMRVIDPDATANTLSIGGQPEGTLTIELPHRAPSDLVPVIELFLNEEQAG